MSENSQNKDVRKIAIVLFNLGGPDSLDSVKNFLFNLFYDPSIIRLPKPFRFILAKLISNLRANKAKNIYSMIGGKSPILEQTINQKNALQKKLEEKTRSENIEFEILIYMRHWHPMAEEVVEKIKAIEPAEIVLLPLYPQFSTTTTGSSIADFMHNFTKIYGTDKKKPPPSVRTICCYPTDDDFILAHSSLIKQAIEKVKNKNFRILFSAHGLPVKIIKDGDPYQWQIEQTVEALVKRLNIPDLDYKITYQSRVGPVEWLKPDTEHEVENTCKEGKSLVIIPIAFVSEHVETLVELDIEYRSIAQKYSIPYIRIPTLQINDIFIDSLAKSVINILDDVKLQLKDQGDFLITSSSLKRICPDKFVSCLCKNN